MPSIKKRKAVASTHGGGEGGGDGNDDDDSPVRTPAMKKARREEIKAQKERARRWSVDVRQKKKAKAAAAASSGSVDLTAIAAASAAASAESAFVLQNLEARKRARDQDFKKRQQQTGPAEEQRGYRSEDDEEDEYAVADENNGSTMIPLEPDPAQRSAATILNLSSPDPPAAVRGNVNGNLNRGPTPALDPPPSFAVTTYAQASQSRYRPDADADGRIASIRPSGDRTATSTSTKTKCNIFEALRKAEKREAAGRRAKIGGERPPSKGSARTGGSADPPASRRAPSTAETPTDAAPLPPAATERSQRGNGSSAAVSSDCGMSEWGRAFAAFEQRRAEAEQTKASARVGVSQDPPDGRGSPGAVETPTDGASPPPTAVVAERSPRGNGSSAVVVSSVRGSWEPGLAAVAASFRRCDSDEQWQGEAAQIIDVGDVPIEERRGNNDSTAADYGAADTPIEADEPFGSVFSPSGKDGSGEELDNRDGTPTPPEGRRSDGRSEGEPFKFEKARRRLFVVACIVPIAYALLPYLSTLEFDGGEWSHGGVARSGGEEACFNHHPADFQTEDFQVVDGESPIRDRVVECRGEFVECPRRGRCHGGMLHDCLDGEGNEDDGDEGFPRFVLNDAGDACVPGPDAAELVSRVSESLTGMTIERTCGGDDQGTNNGGDDDEGSVVRTEENGSSFAPLFALGAVAAKVNEDFDVAVVGGTNEVPMSVQLLLWLHPVFDPKTVRFGTVALFSNEGSTPDTIGLMPAHVTNALPLPWSCYLQLVAGEMLKFLRHAALFLMTNLTKLAWRFGKQYPIHFISAIIAACVAWRLRQLRGRRRRLHEVTYLVREAVMDRLSECEDGEGYAALLLRDDIGHDGAYCCNLQARLFMYDKVWPRVANEIRSDNRIRKFRMAVPGGKDLEHWEMISTPSKRGRRLRRSMGASNVQGSANSRSNDAAEGRSVRNNDPP